MPTRPLKRWTPDIVRQRINVTKLVKRLILHTLGEKDEQGNVVNMTPTQIKSAEILLRKALPDLSAVEYTNQSNDRPVEEWTDAELVAELGRIRARLTSLRGSDVPFPGAPESNEVH